MADQYRLRGIQESATAWPPEIGRRRWREGEGELKRQALRAHIQHVQGALLAYAVAWQNSSLRLRESGYYPLLTVQGP